ncbi:hypothetical protein [Larkinella terrae]|uniref:DUF4595 domain-containing protein n=1 Tax=Larkinella terrae TaxID=2025311 RepID=A0A7K0ERE3_9BACT|nr:hypothetical protein [Larkinella terrae]MRS64121.1 hypothetical protein [Larkinella terrae]
MRLFSKNALTLFGLIVYMGLISCEKDSQLLQPDNGQGSGNGTTRPTQTTENGPIIMVPGGTIQVTPVLVKYGHWQLSYNAKGDLEKLQSSVDPTLYREYSRASNGTGMTIMDYNGGKMKGKTLILFDAKGRCKESYVTSYGIANGQVTTSTKRFNYYYNANNQLEKIMDQDNNQRYDLFTYTNTGNLWQVKRYNNGHKFTMTYWVDAVGIPAVTDKNHLNALWFEHADQVDEFLPIYGKFRKQLVYKFENIDVVNGTSVDQVYYSYKLNNAGYITEKEDTRYTAGQTVKDTYVFGYK